MIVSVLSALALWVWSQLGSFSWEIAAFKTEELLFDLKPKILLGNLECWVLAPWIKCRGCKVWPRIPPRRFIRFTEETSERKTTQRSWMPLSSAQFRSTQARCSAPGVLYLLQVTQVTQVSCLEGKKNLTGIDYWFIFCTSSVVLRFLLFILWMISRVLWRMGSSWDVAKESHNFPGIWRFEKERKNLVKLLSVEFQTWKWRRSLALRR